MTMLKPEGLSPCYMSLASPDIPDSSSFSWIFRENYSGDYQTKFEITLYDSQKNVLTVYTGTSGDVGCSMSTIGYNFVLGTEYIWSVRTWNKDNQVSVPSIMAYFIYDSCPASPPVLWTYIPKQGDVIVRNTYFQEMKTNLADILSDYENVPASLLTNVINLFTGEIIPERKDFDTLQSIVDYLSSTLEGVDSIDIYKLVSDSLGISDLEAIRNQITRLLTIPPKPVAKIDISVDNPSMYTLTALTATSSGVEDKTIDLSWDVNSLLVSGGQFVFTQLSPSRDVRYYMCTFEYGPATRNFFSTLFFKADDLQNGSLRTFTVDWSGLYTASTLGTGGYTLRVTAYDHRENMSDTVSASKTFSSNFKAPLGIDHYEISYEALALGTASADPNAWKSITTTTNKTYTYTITGGSGKYFYSVVGVDKSGLKTAPIYSQGITFDPLKPPGVPSGLHVTQLGITDATIAWNAVPTAENYEVNRYRYNYYGDGPHDGTGWPDQTSTSKYDNGLAANSIYNYFVRAKNRAGNSPWASVNILTKKPIHDSYWDNIHTHSYRDGLGWHREEPGLNHTYCYQGDFGHGKNRGMFYFDNNNIANTLAGADILEVWAYLECIDERYSSGGKPLFNMHNHNKDYGGYPYVYDPEAWGQTFRKGDKGWVQLPVVFGEKLRDRQMQGLTMWTADGSNALGFRNWCQLHIKYQK